ncbi:MAG: hypothetical protein JWO16_1271 [Sphingomonas bacterium]|nr:hypothetical protein [Sphingomonas bacterium]
MEPLITMAEAKTQLKIEQDDTQFDADVGMKLALASGIIVDYIKQPDHDWTVLTVPYPVKAAVLLMLEQLFDNGMEADITDGIKNVLRRSRDPAIA